MDREVLEALRHSYDYMRYKEERAAKRKRKRICFAIQRTAGLIMLAISVFMPIMLDGDITTCIVTVPIGLLLLFSKEMMLYNALYVE